jgi:hypothetical protein
MKPQNFTTEDSEKKNFRFFKNSVNSVVASSPGEFPLKEITKCNRGSFIIRAWIIGECI